MSYVSDWFVQIMSGVGWSASRWTILRQAHEHYPTCSQSMASTLILSVLTALEDKQIIKELAWLAKREWKSKDEGNWWIWDDLIPVKECSITPPRECNRPVTQIPDEPLSLECRMDALLLNAEHFLRHGNPPKWILDASHRKVIPVFLWLVFKGLWLPIGSPKPLPFTFSTVPPFRFIFTLSPSPSSFGGFLCLCGQLSESSIPLVVLQNITLMTLLLLHSSKKDKFGSSLRIL